MLDFPPLSWYNFYMSRETVSETSNAEMVTIPRAEYEEMKSQINWLMEQLRVIKSKQFGSKSEKASEQVEEQLSLLFDEAEAWVTVEEKQAATKVKEHTRSRKSGNVRDILPENIEVVEVEHALPEEERACPQCGETTMSNWLICCSDHWGLSVYLALQDELKKHDLLHADETELQVLHETNRTAQQKSYMWLYRTSGDAEHPIVLYDYAPGRGQEYPNAFLKGFRGYLQTDGYSGYHGLEGVTHVGCWAHARRKFDEACRAVPKGKRSPTAEQGVAYCTQLFELEKEFKALSPEERKKQRLEREKPVLDAMLAWANTRSAAPKSALGKALTYLKNQWPYLNSYLLDGRIELSNNRAERSIKPFVISRKNFLFANTARGAKSSAVIFSLIETAKENGLDPYRYLTWVFAEAPRLSHADPEWASKLLPWNAPATCRSAK